MRRWREEPGKLSHHVIDFESTRISVPIAGLNDAVADRVAARWCASVRKHGAENTGPAIAVRSVRHAADAASAGNHGEFGPWRALLTQKGGSSSIFPVSDEPTVGDDFHRAIDLCVIHALALRGAVVVHGAAFEIGGRGVLVVGSSGTGKSTVVAGALRIGARAVSDDLLLVARRPSGGIGVQTLRRELYFRAPGVSIVPRRLAEKLELFSDSEDVRWRLKPDADPSSFTQSVVPDRVWLVAVDRRLRQSRIAAVDQAQALARLVRGSSGVLLSGGFDRERGPILGVLTTLVNSCQAAKLRLGRDLLEDPVRTMDRLLNANGEG